MVCFTCMTLKGHPKLPFLIKKKKKSHLFVCFCLLIHGISLAKQVPPQLDGHIFYYQKTFGSHQV